jgi:hypothetical protein
LVKKTAFEFTEGYSEFSQKYDQVVDMDPLIETYCDEYALDLSRRLQIEDDRLPAAYTFTALLNPMCGCKPVVVGSGLMNARQYENAMEGLVTAVQDELDAKNPIPSGSAGSDDENSLDGERIDDDNDNRKLAEKEIRRFENFCKLQKYLSKMKYTRSLGCVDAKGRLIEIGTGGTCDYYLID